MNEKVYLVALHQIGISHKKLFSIFEKKQDFKGFYDEVSISSLEKNGFKYEKIQEILENKKKIDINLLYQKIVDLDIKIYTFFDENYPTNLKHIFNIPFLIYVRGHITLPGIAFIGSRNMTSYGENVIKDFVPEIGRYFTIVSGGAYGCDSFSHEIALKNNIKTISIIGTGIDINYPSSNKKLFEEIIKNQGAIISIFPFGEPPNPYNFPIRNEIVAGLSQAIFVVEAREKSGSLITVKLGLDLGKDIFTVPGEIYKQNSIGCNKLIYSSEAKMVLSPGDVLLEYNISNKKNIKKQSNFGDEIEKEIYELLMNMPLNIDEIVLKTGFDMQIILLKIAILELSGLINKDISGKYEII
ncbi:MAG: DNA-processing protein DprA [Candidatus Gracilibacteria bacterium]|nr:DNA-processing protein DprA [Candidatus Gracilibacteria bacterium]